LGNDDQRVLVLHGNLYLVVVEDIPEEGALLEPGVLNVLQAAYLAASVGRAERVGEVLRDILPGDGFRAPNMRYGSAKRLFSLNGPASTCQEGSCMFFLSLLWVPVLAFAYAPGPELIGSPALLVDYTAWSKDYDRFNERGSDTRSFRELVEILYDHEVERPWGDEYFPEANRRLNSFRTAVCNSEPGLRACLLPATLRNDSDVQELEKILLDPSLLALLGARWQLELLSWNMPFREPVFSLHAGPLFEAFSRPSAFWNLQPATVSWRATRHTLLWDLADYRAGFDSQDAPALFALQGNYAAVLDDWHLRDRAMDFAARWKHAISANKRWAPDNAIADSKEIQFQNMFEEQSGDFERVYATLLPKVQALPAMLARFEKERSRGDYPEEVYEQLSYEQLRELLLLQGSYFAVAAEQRTGTSDRQQALESLLTLQRYSKAWRAFKMELSTLAEPLSSSAFVLDEAAGFDLAQTFELEFLKAILGMDPYADKPLFPDLGHGLLAPELFQASYLDENAPDLKQELNGRIFASLPETEQIRILRLYLAPATGKVRPMGLFRLGAAFLSAATEQEMRALAERVHEVRSGNFH